MMSSAHAEPIRPAVPAVDAPSATLAERVAGLADPAAWAALLDAHKGEWTPALVDELAGRAMALAREDLTRAEHLAAAAARVAGRLEDPGATGRALRTRGHMAALRGRYADALASYEAALESFESAQRALDAAITYSGALQTLIYLGDYPRAFRWARKARHVFAAQGDHLRLARLDCNLGNVFYRQDRFREALARYRSAGHVFARCGAPSDVAVMLRNVAVCFISLGDFRRAATTHRRSRAFCQRHGLSRLVTEADYNVAYLHFLRGDYTRAIGLFEAARARSQQLDDPYHEALCDLDQSELSVELNLDEEGELLAARACARFEALGMGYERGKALANLAIAVSRQGRTGEALRLFTLARRAFTREGNRVWPPQIDLYRASVLARADRTVDAERLAGRALKHFAHSPLVTKAALCELLLGRLRFLAGDLEGAQQRCHAALQRLDRLDVPALSSDISVTLGQIHEAAGDRAGACLMFQRARAQFERIGSRLRGDEVKVSFFSNKPQVYEALVAMALTSGDDDEASTFACIEEAKSRSLADLLAFRTTVLGTRSPRHDVVERVRRARAALNGLMRQIEVEGLSLDQPRAETLDRLRRRVREEESRLSAALDELGHEDGELAALHQGGVVPLPEIQASLPPNGALLEYFVARGDLVAVCVTRAHFSLHRLGPFDRVRAVVRRLLFQLSKGSRGIHAARFDGPYEMATTEHLRTLYDWLIRPLDDALGASRLIVVPHNELHRVPFHALLDGSTALVDRFSVSYAPSASVHHLCAGRPARGTQAPLVLGVPDPKAPYIRQEVDAVCRALPDARAFVGRHATARRLRVEARGARIVHIATHGVFRRDNPMFSSMRLADGELHAFDLYDLELSADLVALSGCGTGLGVSVGTDELLGLTRGWLYAGARAVLATLWDVHDRISSELIATFYQRLGSGESPADALRWAMRQARSEHPHPYHWAPFMLVGSA